MKNTSKVELLLLTIAMITTMIMKFVVVDVYKYFELNIVINVLFNPTVALVSGISAYMIASRDKIQIS